MRVTEVETNGSEGLRDGLSIQRVPRPPCPPDLISGAFPNGHVVVDLMTSFFLILGNEDYAEIQPARLLAQVVPVAEALIGED